MVVGNFYLELVKDDGYIIKIIFGDIVAVQVLDGRVLTIHHKFIVDYSRIIAKNVKIMYYCN